MKKFLPLAFTTLALGACGGGGDAGSGTTTTTTNDATASSEGLWTGSLNSTKTGAAHTATLIVLPTGEMRMIWNNCVQLVASSTTANGYFSGTGNAYAPDGSHAACPTAVTFPDATSLAALSVSGQVTAASSLIGTYTAGGDTGTYNLTYSALYARAGTLARAAGTYSNGTLVLTIDATGAVTGTSGTATVTGSLTTIDTAKNAYRIALVETGSTAGTTTTSTSTTSSTSTATSTTTATTTTTSVSGLATLIDYGTSTDNYLLISVTNSTSGFAVPLIRQ
ncbi:MAG: hypothetical protein ACRYHA_05690 [Janthinobacterium lividum]